MSEFLEYDLQILSQTKQLIYLSSSTSFDRAVIQNLKNDIVERTSAEAYPQFNYWDTN